MDALDRAFELKREGRLSEAESVLREALSSLATDDGGYPGPGRPGHEDAARALASLADLLVRQDRIPEAEDIADLLLSWNPVDGRGLVVKGNARIKQERYEQAVEYLEAARGSVSPAYLAGRLALALYQGQDAGKLYRLSQEEAGRDHPAVLKYLGLTREKEGRYQEATSLYERVLKLDPDDSFTYSRLLEVRTRDMPSDEARRDLDRVIKVKGAGAQILAVRARNAARAGRDTEAARDYAEAARLEPTNPFFWSQAGFAAIRAGDRSMAIPLLQEALRRKPTDHMVGQSLAKCYRVTRNHRQGIEFLETLIADKGTRKLWGLVKTLERDLDEEEGDE